MERVEMFMAHLVSHIALWSRRSVLFFWKSEKSANQYTLLTAIHREVAAKIEQHTGKEFAAPLLEHLRWRKKLPFQFSSRTVIGHFSHAWYARRERWNDGGKIESTLDEMQSTKRNNVICHAPLTLSHSNEWINDSEWKRADESSK